MANTITAEQAIEKSASEETPLTVLLSATREDQRAREVLVRKLRGIAETHEEKTGTDTFWGRTGEGRPWTVVVKAPAIIAAASPRASSSTSS